MYSLCSVSMILTSADRLGMSTKAMPMKAVPPNHADATVCCAVLMNLSASTPSSYSRRRSKGSPSRIGKSRVRSRCDSSRQWRLNTASVTGSTRTSNFHMSADSHRHQPPSILTPADRLHTVVDDCVSPSSRPWLIGSTTRRSGWLGAAESFKRYTSFEFTSRGHAARKLPQSNPLGNHVACPSKQW